MVHFLMWFLRRAWHASRLDGALLQQTGDAILLETGDQLLKN